MGQNENEDPTLSEVVKEAILSSRVTLHTALPGQVEKFDKSTGRADIQPLIKKKYKDGTEVNLPVITSVPVGFQRTQNASISFPLVAGDTGLIIFSERSMDKWLVSGGVVLPDDTRKHNLSDGIFYPGLYPFNDPDPNAEDDAMVLRIGSTKFRLQDDGKMQFLGTDAEELVKILSELTTACEAILTNTMIGAQPPINKATFTALKARIAKLEV